MGILRESRHDVLHKVLHFAVLRGGQLDLVPRYNIIGSGGAGGGAAVVEVCHGVQGALLTCDEGLVHVLLGGLDDCQGVQDAVPDLSGGEVCLGRFTRDL